MNNSGKNVCYKLRDVPRMSTRSFATGTGEADNTEEFADEKWSIHVQHYVNAHKPNKLKNDQPNN